MSITRVHETLRGRLRELLAPLENGSALPSGWRLDTWESEQGITLTLRSGNRVLDVELEASDPSRACFARTDRFNIYYSTLERRRGGSDLSPEERAALESVVALLREREHLLPPEAHRDEPTKVQIREVEVDRALVREGDDAYYLNPYVGCMLACPFCYAMHRADFSRSLEGLPKSPWGRWVDVKINAPEVLAREVKTLPPGTVRMSPIITDPYQPIEHRFRITRGCLTALAETAFQPVVLTRSSMVLEDIELLKRCHGAAVGMSVPTDDDSIRASFEPATEPISARIETLAALRKAGLRTFATIQPILPMNPERLVSLVAPNVVAVRIAPLYEKPRVEQIFVRLGQREALNERWELDRFEELKAAFAKHGIPVNPEGPEWAFLR